MVIGLELLDRYNCFILLHSFNELIMQVVFFPYFVSEHKLLYLSFAFAVKF